MAEITSSTETTYDYSMLGSFGSEATQSLNGDMISKIRAAEEKAILDPIKEKLADIDLESEKIVEIGEKVNEFLEVMKPFDLYTSGISAFDQISASTVGDSVLFDAIDTSKLENGITSVSISQLAQKDVYQTTTFSDNTALIADGQDAGDKISITVGGTTYDFSTEGKSYNDLASDIDMTDGIDASVEQVGDNIYRIIIKSSETGTANALTITETGVDLGLTTDSDLDGIPDNKMLSAQNLIANVDGVEYNTSSNTITIDGNLQITATKVGDSTLSIQKDYSGLASSFQMMADSYNELVDLINDEIYSAESSISDKSTLRDLVSGIKNLFFEQFGADVPEFGTQVDEYGDIVYSHSNVTNNDKSVFNYGFSFDEDGHMQIDNTVLNEAISNNPEELEKIFTGTVENQGLGTLLKEYLDNLDSMDGMLTTYSTNMLDRRTNLEEDKEKTIETLDTKYDAMVQQFIEYANLIAQMEASFGGLQMMIAQSTASD